LEKQISSLLDDPSTSRARATAEPAKFARVHDVVSGGGFGVNNVRATEEQAPRSGQTTKAMPQVKDESLTAKVDASVSMIRSAIVSTRAPAQEEEDPDKTLVDDQDDEAPPSKQKPQHSATKPAKSPASPQSPARSSPSSSDNDSTASTEIEFKPWKNHLQPHQRDLYHDLVKIAQRLTQYLAHQETSTEIMMDENHRNYLRLLAQEQAEQKRRYKKLKQQLREKRKERCEVYEKCGEKLQAALDIFKAGNEDRVKCRQEKDVENRSYEELLQRLS
jgi:hypothetical protein